MSSACVCHTDEHCFHCDVYHPVKQKSDATRESLLRLFENLLKTRDEALDKSIMQDSPYWTGYWTAVSNVSGHTLKELRKVLNELKEDA